jgi:hypothetical protein
MVTGPGDELAAPAAGRGYLRVSHAEREQVIGALKAAFVRGMLAKDEFDVRVGQAFASRTYAELAAVTADLPAEPAAAQPPVPARSRVGQPVPRPGRVMAAATGLYGGVQAFVFLSPWPAGSENDPAGAKIALFLLSNPIYLVVLLICVACLIAGRRERRSSGRPPRRPAPGAGGQASRYPPSAGPGGELPPAGRGYQHTAEAERSRPARPPRQARGHRGALAGCLPLRLAASSAPEVLGRLPAPVRSSPRQYRATPGSMQITLIWTLHSTVGFEATTAHSGGSHVTSWRGWQKRRVLGGGYVLPPTCYTRASKR